MSAIWEIPMPPTDKLVLLALADCANDEGHCWPSIATIARKSGVSERSVQRAIRKAETDGLVRRQEVIGKGCKYHLTPRHTVTPDKVSPATNATPTPDTVSPKPSGTIIVECVEREREIRALPQFKAFAAMRRQIRKPMNATADQRIIAKLIKLEAEHGFPPGDVLDQSTENCWAGVFPLKDDQNERSKTGGNGVGHMGGPGPSPLLQARDSLAAAVARNYAGAG